MDLEILAARLLLVGPWPCIHAISVLAVSVSFSRFVNLDVGSMRLEQSSDHHATCTQLT